MVPAMRSALAAAVAFVRGVWPPIPVGMYVSVAAFVASLLIMGGARRGVVAVIVGAMLLGYRWGWGLLLLIQLFWLCFGVAFLVVEPSFRGFAMMVLVGTSVVLLYSRPTQRYLDDRTDRRARMRLPRRGIGA